jgi:hypothetical protein
LEVHDLLLSKYVAARPKDLAFTQAAARARLADPAVLQDRVDSLSLPAEARAAVSVRIARDFGLPNP